LSIEDRSETKSQESFDLKTLIFLSNLTLVPSSIINMEDKIKQALEDLHIDYSKIAISIPTV